MLYTPLDTIEDPSHPLLEPPTPSYTRVTVRRALAVWLHCGQRNSFRAVCDYYHRLEALEDELTEDRRALSRHPEMALFTNHPPTSEYLQINYPRLYATNPKIDNNCLQKLDSLRCNQDVKLEYCKIVKEPAAAKPIAEETNAGATKQEKDAGATKQEKDAGATKQEIVETSQMIGNFCKNSKIALNIFLRQFKDHALKCDLKDTVLNVGFYIKRKMVHEEMKKHFELKKNFPDLSKVSKFDQMGKPDVVIDKLAYKGTYAEIIKADDKIETLTKLSPKVKTNDVLNQSVQNANDKVKKVDKVKSASPMRILKRDNTFQQNVGKVEVPVCRQI